MPGPESEDPRLFRLLDSVIGGVTLGSLCTNGTHRDPMSKRRKSITLRSFDCFQKRGNFLITRRSGVRIPPPLPRNEAPGVVRTSGAFSFHGFDTRLRLDPGYSRGKTKPVATALSSAKSATPHDAPIGNSPPTDLCSVYAFRLEVFHANLRLRQIRSAQMEGVA